MFNGSNCDRKSQLSEILTEPLNPRATCIIESVFGFLRAKPKVTMTTQTQQRAKEEENTVRLIEEHHWEDKPLRVRTPIRSNT